MACLAATASPIGANQIAHGAVIVKIQPSRFAQLADKSAGEAGSMPGPVPLVTSAALAMIMQKYTPAPAYNLHVMIRSLARWFGAAANYVQTARGFRGFFDTPTPADCLGVVRSQLDNRESAFLDTLRRVVLENPTHPYRQMLQLAQCSEEDVASVVQRAGLETALEQLRAAGVYLTQDEFKGNVPIVRQGRAIPASPQSFRNPLAHGTVRHVTSGSRGKAVQSFRSAEFMLHQEAMHEIVVREFGLEQRAQVVLRPTLPSALGLQDCAIVARKGHRLEGWYSSGPSGGWYAPATAGLVLVARGYGCRIPFPAVLPENDFSTAAERVARLCAEGIPCLVSGPASPAVRLAAAALERGLDIRGTLFLVSGESLTDPKRAVIEQAGGQPFARYGVSEMGFIGHGCRQMTTGDCVHLYSNAIAAITQRVTAPLTDIEVGSLLYTTLLPTAPLVLINFEVNDSGVLEKAECDCEFSRLGFHWRIRDIFSFGKMTGHGITLLGTELIRVLEQVLPARLGGVPGDFQLIEHEGRAQTTVELRVSPRVRGSSAERIRECFLEEIRLIYGGSLAGRVWRHAEALEVVLAEPMVTISGKINPLHLLGPGARR